MCLGLCTMPPRPPYTRGVIPCGWNWHHSGRSPSSTLSENNQLTVCHCSVNVTTVVTGGVQSRIARTDRTLKPNSIYAPIEEEYLRRVKHSQDGAMPNAAYARSVVTQILYGSAPWRWLWPWARGQKSWIWEGNKSWLVWLLVGGWTWSGFLDRVMTRMFKLYRLRK